MIRIGIIGAGRICAAHARAALAVPETGLAAIADIDAERARQAAEQFGCRAYTDYRELLTDPNVDAVVISLPHGLHREVTVDALHAGKHVLLEKPMAMTVAECDAMIAAAITNEKTLMVAHSQQFFPANRFIRRLIATGEIGDLVLATDTWYKPFFDGGKRPPWFLDDAQGGGMWPMNGSHMIDRLMFLLGRRVTAVKARVGNPVFGLSSDTGMAFLDLEGGISATIQHVGYREGVNRFEAEITGTEGQLKLSGDSGGGSVIWRSRGGNWDAVPVPPVEITLRDGHSFDPPLLAFPLEMQEFARSILEQRPPSVTAEYGREVVRVLTACEESSRTGSEVRL